jgi:hypothetical protein
MSHLPRVVGLAILATTISVAAHAALILTVDNTVLTGPPGTQFTLTGSVLNENVTGEDLVWLEPALLTGTVLSVQDALLPDYIQYGATYTGNIAVVGILGSAAPGVYPGNLLSFSFDTMNGRTVWTTTAALTANVTSVPEPGTLGLLILGLAAVGAIRRRR